MSDAGDSAVEEVDNVKKNCEMIEKVMKSMEQRGTKDLPEEARVTIEELRGKMILFASSMPLSGDKLNKKTKVKQESASSSGSDSDEGSSSDRGSFSKKVISAPHLHSRKGKKTLKKKTKSGEDRQMAEFLQHIDSRTASKPEPFNLTSGQAFGDFLEVFEEYCSNTFRGNKNTWVSELGRCLEGEMHDAFDAMKGPNMTYRGVVRKLTTWYDDAKELRQANRKSLFVKASLKPNESMRIYGARLEKLFTLAYPNRCVDTSRVLREKYTETVPRKFRKRLREAMTMVKTMTAQPMKWERIMTLASLVDGESDDTASGTNDEQHTVWAVNQASNARDGHRSREQTGRQAYGLSDRTSGREFSWQTAPTESDRNRAGRCFHCGRIGHKAESCRRRLRQCLWCGSGDHFVANCTSRGSANRSRSYSREQNVRDTSRRSNSVSFNLDRNRVIPREGPQTTDRSRPNSNSQNTDFEYSGLGNQQSSNIRPLRVPNQAPYFESLNSGASRGLASGSSHQEGEGGAAATPLNW